MHKREKGIHQIVIIISQPKEIHRSVGNGKFHGLMHVRQKSSRTPNTTVTGGGGVYRCRHGWRTA